MSPFEATVLKIVRAIPPGKVMSYGQIALYAGKPGTAREVGGAMRSLGKEPAFPWWRVLNSEGRLSISGNADANARMQQELLEKEGVVFHAPLLLAMDRYMHHATEEELRAFGLDDLLLRSALHKYGPSANQRLDL